MKSINRIISLVLCLAIGIGVNAQIRKTIMGVTIGVSTKSAVFNKLTNQGYTFSEEPHALNIIDAEYAGYKWKKIKFCYLNNVLYKVEFNDPSVPGESYWSGNVTPRATIFENLSYSINNKYKRYLTNGIYSDGKTQIRFAPGQMIYENIAMAKKAGNAMYDDL
jgi:hypothetical protein